MDRLGVERPDHAPHATAYVADMLDLVAELIDRAPGVVLREDLIERIWRRTYVGSNVVDTVVRTLRKKLGLRRHCIQTVPKAGYRYVSSGTSGEPCRPIE